MWVLVTAFITGCAGDSGGNSPPAGIAAPVAVSPQSFDYFSMFVGIADDQIIPNYTELANQADLMAADDGAIARYCSAVSGDADGTPLAEARTAWRDTMTAMQQAELHRFGPINENNSALHERLLVPVNSSFSSCGVDQSVLLGQQSDFDLNSRLSNQKGLTAIEYLLFSENLDHSCPAQIPETTDWNERGLKERQSLRCAHALRLARDVSEAADAVLEGWLPTGANYRATFANPGNAEDSIVLLSDGLFYVDIDLKDSKLGEPLGLHDSCNGFSCPERVESAFSRSTFDSIRANLVGFQLLFNGGQGLSFDDLIASEGVPEVSKRINSQLTDSLDLLDSIDTSLFDSAAAINSDGVALDCINSAANPETIQTIPACALHGYIKRLTDSMRTDFIATVNLDLPERAQSDND